MIEILVVLFVYLIPTVIAFVLLYYIIKATVKNGIKEEMADGRAILPGNFSNNNPERVALQRRYDNGGITFEVYQSEWIKLNR